jgi:hypothetical protein
VLINRRQKLLWLLSDNNKPFGEVIRDLELNNYKILLQLPQFGRSAGYFYEKEGMYKHVGLSWVFYIFWF